MSINSNATKRSKFGDDVQIGTIESIDNEGGAVKVKFKARSANAKFQANTPYIIKTSSDINEFEVSNVNIVVASPVTNVIVQEYDPDEDETVNVTVGTFYGTLKAGTSIPNNNLFLSNNKFYYSTGSTTIKGFRGYFYLKDFNTSSSAPEFVVDGETTNIEGIQIVNGDGRIYNLNGQHVENPTKKGVYIQNGKKVVMKK